MKVYIDEDTIVLDGNCPHFLAKELPSLEGNRLPFLPVSSFVMVAYITKFKNTEISKKDKQLLREMTLVGTLPKAQLETDSQVHIVAPAVPSYLELLTHINARRKNPTTYTVPKSRLYEMVRMLTKWEHFFLPKIPFSKELKEYLNEPLIERGDVEGLFSIPFEELYSIQYGYKIKTVDGFERLHCDSAGDLLLMRPRKYTDRQDSYTIWAAPFGKNVFFKGKIVEWKPSFDNRKIEFVFEDEKGKVADVTLWGGYYLKQKFSEGETVILKGMKIRGSMISATEILSVDEVIALPVQPNYKASPSTGLTEKVLTNCVQEVFSRFDGSQLLSYIKETDLPFWEALQMFHFPQNPQNYLEAVDNLSYYELLLLQLRFLENKELSLQDQGLIKNRKEDGYYENALFYLPYKLTRDQENALSMIFTRFRGKSAANILLSANTGAGKTVVASLATLYTADNKQQSAILAPTEVLAKQLYDALINLVKPLKEKPEICFYTGSLSTKEAKEYKEKIKNGEIDIIVGTHAILSLDYDNLGFVCIDEQQKFGTEQRERLKEKRDDGKFPDVLSQTATPIPRSTAQAFYGDIDLITIESMPEGRLEVETSWIQFPPKHFVEQKVEKDIWKKILKEIDNGHQVFVVCPLVEDKDSDVMSVKDVTKRLKRKLKDIEVKSVYGKMARNKQVKTLEDFREGKFPVLVASSVVEVGVDIPEATVMIILNAERFGASSLHQIRGRVGRNSYQSYCYLVSDNLSKATTERLESLVKTNNGFEIALADLKTRKEGDVLGTRQHGESVLRFCDLTDIRPLLPRAQKEAKKIFTSPFRIQALADAKAFFKEQEEVEA